MKVYAYIYNNKLYIVQNPQNLPSNISYQEFDVETTSDLYIESNQIKVKTPEQKFQEAKQKKLKELDDFTTNYIYKYYPPNKQQSDVADRDYWSTLLIRKFGYSYQELAQKTYDTVADIIDGIITLQQGIEKLSTDENGNPLTYTFSNQEYPVAPVWEQLLKIGIRVAWVQQVKQVYSWKKRQIEEAQSLEELNSITFSEEDFPPYPEHILNPPSDAETLQESISASGTLSAETTLSAGTTYSGAETTSASNTTAAETTLSANATDSASATVSGNETVSNSETTSAETTNTTSASTTASTTTQ